MSVSFKFKGWIIQISLCYIPASEILQVQIEFFKWENIG